ncbi:hypothetical protein SAMN02746009_01621 [Hymenobacter psychrotolerans DSM 18569]|uniref:Lipoprotein n=2 Tax=Hymenobacter psychrotolerans TaxID=344998 RepID=A0A1M6VIL2_9BACT|nr:hypothetical protein SAMN02746009_01621 [Hymenobacter psychrotolerans DSM 18569]
MTMFRTLRAGLLIGVGSLAIGSCISPPDFPDTPSIEFKDLSVQRHIVNGVTAVDSVVVTIGFKDGDGDLGLNEEEYNNPPYQRLNTDGSLNLNHWNYYFNLFVKAPGETEFKPYRVTPELLELRPEDYYGQYPHLEPNSEKKAPLQGNLRLRQGFALGSPFYPGQEVRFEITIKDRALNTSNTVTTSSFVVAPR